MQNRNQGQKVICFGEVLIDLLSNRLAGDAGAGQETFSKFAGGAPANVAVTVAKLGGRGYFSGMLGEDMFGHYLLQELQSYGVNTDYTAMTPAAKTALAFVTLDESGERQFEFYRPPAADLCFQASQFQSGWFDEPGIFHYCSNSLTEADIADATMAGAQMAGAQDWLISFDVNLRENLWQADANPRQRITAALAPAHIVKLAREELLYLAADTDPDAFIADLLSGLCQLVLVTDGGKPLRWYSKSGSGTVTPPHIQMLDATAAGDAFMGGLVYQLSLLGLSASEFADWVKVPEALQPVLYFACCCGAHAATQKGAFPSLPTTASIQSFIEGLAP